MYFQKTTDKYAITPSNDESGDLLPKIQGGATNGLALQEEEDIWLEYDAGQASWFRRELKIKHFKVKVPKVVAAKQISVKASNFSSRVKKEDVQRFFKSIGGVTSIRMRPPIGG